MPMIFDKDGRSVPKNELRDFIKRSLTSGERVRAFFPLAEVRLKKRDATPAEKIKTDAAPKEDPTADAQATAVDKVADPIVAVINTADLDRYGTIVDPKGCDFEQYLRNPIVLWQHGMDMAIGNWPVGAVQSITRSDAEMEVELSFDTESELGAELDRLYRKKILRGFSIGFLPSDAVFEMVEGKEIMRYTKWELLELSAVSVPANAQALSRAVGEVKTTELKQALRDFEKGGKSAALLIDEDADLGDVVNPLEQATRTNDESYVEVEFDGMKIRIKAGEEPLWIEKLQKLIDLKRETPKQEFPIEWERDFDVAAEFKAATGEAVRSAMTALTIDLGESKRFLLPHHHADGHLSWRALATQMARLLTEPMNLTPEQCTAAYEHIAEHYRALGIEPPEAGAKTPEQAYDLALEGRMAHLDEQGNAWLFVEPVARGGAFLPGFVRCDDSKSLLVGAAPEMGRLTDHRKWGQRRKVEISRDERLLEELANNQRALKELMEQRKGAKFSKATATKVNNTADSLDELATSLRSCMKQLSAVAGELRDMVAQPEGDVTKSVGGQGQGPDDGGSNVSQATQGDGSRKAAGFARKVAPGGR